MSKEFKKNLKKIFETYGYRSGFGNQISEMPVVGMDYEEEEPIISPQSNPEEVIDNVNDEQVINLLNDILVAAPDNTDVQALVSKAKRIVNGEDEEREGVKQPGEIVDEPSVDMDPTFGAQSPGGAGGAAQGMAESEVVDNTPGSVNPIEGEITNGETLPMGEPRVNDIERSEINYPSPDYDSRDDNMAEIASLLVTIGHMLQNERIIPNKFDVPLVVKYINHNFGKQTPEEMQAMCESQSVSEGLGKTLATGALGAAAAMGGGEADAASSQTPLNIEKNASSVPIDQQLDIQTMMNLRNFTHRFVSKYLADDKDPNSLNNIINSIIPISTQIIIGKLDPSDAIKRIPPSMREDPQSRMYLQKYFEAVEKFEKNN